MKIVIATVILFMCDVFTASSQEKDIHYQWLRDYQKVDSRKEIKIPDILGYKTLKGDFHMHTIFSDGQVLPATRVNEAWREGLDVIAITDHTTPQPGYVVADYNTSWKMARSAAKRRGITLIHATEYTKSEPVGHLNILFVPDANPFRGDSLTPTQAMNLAKEMEAFVIYNHPGWPDKNSELDMFHIDHIAGGQIQGLEVFNSSEYYPVTMDYINQYGLAPFSNTDIHSSIHMAFDVEKVTRNLTLVFAKDKSEKAIKEAMFAGRTVAYANNLLVGNPVYLVELLRNSLEVWNKRESEFGFSCSVTNNSDITWYLDGPDHQYITFPANRTVQISESTGTGNSLFEVANTFVNSVDHLEVSLNFLLLGNNEVMMPTIRQNLTNIKAGTHIDASVLTPGAEIRYTLDGSEPTDQSALYSGPLKVEKSSLLKMKAFKAKMTPSRLFNAQILIDRLHDPVRITRPRSGLTYRYYEGQFSSVTEVKSTGRFVKEGSVGFPDISVADTSDYFGIYFEGFLYAPQDGEYRFILESDDGTILKINDIILVDNDGSHSLKKAEGEIKLKKGYHHFELGYFDDYDEQELRLYWAVPGSPFQIIESSFFFSNNP